MGPLSEFPAKHDLELVPGGVRVEQAVSSPPLPAPVADPIELPRDKDAAANSGRGRRARLGAAAGFALVIAASLFLTLVRHRTSYNVFVDEVTYSAIGRSVALGHGVDLYGKQFYLHPPAFFYVEAAAIKLFGNPRSVLSLVLDLRILNGLIATLDCVLMMLLVRRAVGRWWAVGVGLFMACDPFLLVWDGRVVLEPLATTASVLALLCVVHLTSLTAGDGGLMARGGVRERRAVALAVLAGLAAGIALLTKETYAFVGVVPLALALISGRVLPRRWSAIALGTAAAVCAAYLATIVAAGRLNGWWEQQHTGLLRATGAKQISGFNQAGHASFASRVFADGSLYVGTYLLLALVSLATAWSVVCWWRRWRAGGHFDAPRAALTLWAACGAGYVAFSVFRGAFEEQIFYPYLVIALPLAADVLARVVRGLRGARRPRFSIALVGALVAGILVYGLTVDARVRAGNDDTFASLVDWTHSHVRPTTLVDSTDGVSNFLIQDGHVGEWLTLHQVRRHHPDFVVVATGLTEQGYVKLDRRLSPWLRRHGTVVFNQSGLSIGRLIVYRLHWRTPPAV